MGGAWACSNAQTDADRGTPSRNFSVARVKKDLFARSNVGFIATNRDSTSPGDPYNRSFGVDGNFVFLEHLNAQAFAASTYSPGLSDDHWAGRIRTNWDSDRWFVNGEHLLIQRAVNPEMGWLPRRDMRKTKLQLDFKPRPRLPHVRQLFLRSNLDYITNQAGTLETRNQDGTFESLFQSGDRIIAKYIRLYDRIRRPFSIQNRVTVTPGIYEWGIGAGPLPAEHDAKPLGRDLLQAPVGVLRRRQHGGDLEPALETEREPVDCPHLPVHQAVAAWWAVHLPSGEQSVQLRVLEPLADQHHAAVQQPVAARGGKRAPQLHLSAWRRPFPCLQRLGHAPGHADPRHP
jgi:hypothetical protein